MYIGFILGSWAEEEISLLLSVFWFGRLKNSFSYLFKTLLCCSTDRYPVCDDDDDSDMEANWEEIMKEEKRRLVKFPKSQNSWNIIMQASACRELCQWILKDRCLKVHEIPNSLHLLYIYIYLPFFIFYSAKIAKEEDDEQLRLIEEEERRERMRRMAKKRKLSQQWFVPI